MPSAFAGPNVPKRLWVAGVLCARRARPRRRRVLVRYPIRRSARASRALALDPARRRARLVAASRAPEVAHGIDVFWVLKPARP